MSISYVSTSSNGTSSNGTAALTIARPSGVVTGDLMIAFVSISTPVNKDSNVSDHPDGWTFIRSAVDLTSSEQGVRMNMYFRKVNAEPSNYTWVCKNINGRMAITIVAYRGADTVTGSVIALQTDKSKTRATGSLTAPSRNWLVSAFADAKSSTFTAPGITRGANKTSNISMVVSDSNGLVTPGTSTRTAKADTEAFVAVNSLLSMSEINVVNLPPSVDAGPDQKVITPSTVQLSGNATDDTGIGSIQWIQTAGAAATITNANQLNASVSIASAGTYAFRLTVTDNLGTSSSDEMQVIANTSGSGGSATSPLGSATISNAIYYILDATGSTARSGGSLSYALSPSGIALAISPGVWAVSPQANQTTYTIVVTESGSAATSTVTLTVPAAATAPTSTDGVDSGVETLVYTNGAWQ